MHEFAVPQSAIRLHILILFEFVERRSVACRGLGEFQKQRRRRTKPRAR